MTTRKLLLLAAMLAGSSAAMNATTRYFVPVSDPSTLTADSKVIIEAYNTGNEEQRILTISADGQSASWLTKTEIINNANLTSDNVIWTYTPVSNVTCTTMHTGDSSNADSSAGGVFNLSNGGNYWSVGTQTNFPTSYPTTTTATAATNYFELVNPGTQPTYDSNSHFFGIHYYHGSSAYFDKFLGVNASGNYGLGTTNATTAKVSVTMSGVWSYMFRVYKVVETADDDATDMFQTLKDKAKAKITEAASKLVTTTIATAIETTDYTNRVDALEFTSVEEAATALDKIVSDYISAYYAQLDGKYFTIKNASAGIYINADASKMYAGTVASTASLWKISYKYNNDTNTYYCTLYNPTAEKYFGSLSSFTQNKVVPASTEPAEYEILPSSGTSDAWTLRTSAFYSHTYPFLHYNASYGVIYWSDSGDSSRWFISEADDDVVSELNADKTRVYVPVTSPEQIVDGGKYILESYNTGNSEMRILTMNGSNQVGFQVPSDMMQNTDLTLDRTIWTFTSTADDFTCTNTTHSSSSAGSFSLNTGGRYLKWAETGTAIGATANNSKIEFFKLEDSSDNSGALFGIHYYYGVNSSNQDQYRYGVVNAAGSMGFNTKTGIDVTNGDSKTGYSSYFRLYRVYNSEGEAPSGSTATSLLTKMKETAEALITPYATTITDFNTTKAEALNAITNAATNDGTLYAAGTDMTTAVTTTIEAYWEKFNGLYVTIKSATGTYANAAEGATGLTVTSATTSDAIWKLERVSGTTQYKIYNPLYELYVGSLTSFTQNTQIPLAATGVNYTLTMANTENNVYLATTSFSDKNCWHVTSVRTYPVYWSGAGSDNSVWTMTAATDDQMTRLENDITLRADKINAITWNSEYSDNLNEYNVSDAEAYATAYSTLQNATELTEAAKTAYTSLQNFHTNRVINQPATGSYIRIKTGPAWSTTNATAFSSSQPYLTCVNNSDNSKAAFVTNLNSTDNIANSIFLLTDDSKLLAYATGRYGKTYHLNFDVSANGSTNTASAAATFAFAAASSETGTYTVKYGSRYLYTGTTLYTDSGDGTNTTGGYYFQLEYVSELPVTTNADGFATLKVPVAVTIPTVDDATFYVGNIEGTTLTLHQAQAGETYAANTGIIVNAAASTTVNFPIATDATDAISTYTNAFQGSNVAQQVSNLVTDSDKSVYANSELASTEESTTESAAVRRRVASSEDGTTSMTFTKLDDTDVIGANAAMLVLDSTNTWADDNGVISMSLSATEDEDATFNVSNGDTVGITTVVVEHADGTSEIYDLQGRRVNPANLRRGIYIVNGEKRAM